MLPTISMIGWSPTKTIGRRDSGSIYCVVLVYQEMNNARRDTEQELVSINSPQCREMHLALTWGDNCAVIHNGPMMGWDFVAFSTPHTTKRELCVCAHIAIPSVTEEFARMQYSS